jgi:hypothetical protein
MPHSTRQTAIAAAVSIRTAAGCRWCGQRERDGVAVSAASLGVGLMPFGFEEFDSQHRRLVKETGWLPDLEGRFKLAWQRATTGARLRWAAGVNEWSLDGRVTRTVNPQVEVDFGNAFDAATLDLGARWGWRTAASWLRHVGPRLAASLSVFYESWDLGQSEVETLISKGVPAGTVFQPRSESRNYGALLSLQRDW